MKQHINKQICAWSLAAGLLTTALTGEHARIQELEAQVDQLESAQAPIQFGGLTIGGAIRANYLVGDYTESDTSATRGDKGAVTLDTLRLNLDFENGPWIGKGEYRYYPGYSANNSDSYHFPHTAWIGYNFESTDQIQVGLNRTPFGPGPFGISQSWFFDQHYYVGLSDNMNVGVKYTMNQIENLTIDLAYYYSSAPNGGGNRFGNNSVRYSYDVVNESGDGYRERNQFNIRAIYSAELGQVASDIGASAQYGILDSQGPQGNGNMFALSGHAVNAWKGWTLAAQLTYYNFDVEANVDRGGNLLSDKVVQLGAYDFPTLVAAEALVPAISLSYSHAPDQIAWLDSVTPYVEYSSIVKSESSFNNSDMVVIGTAFGRGGWFIYADLVFSNGNDFVGNKAGYGDTSALVNPGARGGSFFSSNRLGANPTNEWETRFNINFGYYF